MRRGPARTACRAVNFENELFARQLRVSTDELQAFGCSCKARASYVPSVANAAQERGHKHSHAAPCAELCVPTRQAVLHTRSEAPSVCHLSLVGMREMPRVSAGFDHPDAPVLDVGSAAAQLKQATHDVQVRTLLQQERKDRI
ncbi:hypothetical protein QJQ45_030124 [Haematococcus lacustris]|nr:hypothetical protein QJQ45_030124 [Haematococcus lacustris]